MRIVSLLPSATELLCALGLRRQLVGVSHSCDYPEDVQALPIVTDCAIPKSASSLQIDSLTRQQQRSGLPMYQLDLPLLESLAPDLIVTQSLCDVCALSEEDLKQALTGRSGHPEVISLEPGSVEEVLDSLLLLGSATDRSAVAEDLVRSLRARLEEVCRRTDEARSLHPLRVAFLEWLDPPYHSGHWTPGLVEMAGGIDCLGAQGKPSGRISWEEIWAARPDVLIFCCCGYSAQRTLQDALLPEIRKAWEDFPGARARQAYCFDGNAYFNRPGPRLVDSLELLAHTLHPQIHPPPPVSFVKVLDLSQAA